jgi:hypothetical protein
MNRGMYTTHLSSCIDLESCFVSSLLVEARREVLVVIIIQIRFGDILTIPAWGWGLHGSLRIQSCFRERFTTLNIDCFDNKWSCF